MEITDKLLQTIHKRLEQVFFAKTDCKLDTIVMYEDGSFYCSYSYNISYGGVETIGEHITAKDLTADIDKLVKIREAKEEIERQEREKRQKENKDRYEREQKAKRFAEFEKLKKEFGN